MPSQARRTISLFRTIVLIAVTGLWIAAAALTVAAQNSVPASAVEAAKTPEVRSPSRPSHAARRRGRSQPGTARVLFRRRTLTFTITVPSMDRSMPGLSILALP